MVFFNQASQPSTMTYCCCCVYSRMIRSHERRGLGVLLVLVLLLCVLSYDTQPRKTRVRCAARLGPRSERVDRQLAVVWLRRGAATALAHHGFIRRPTHGSQLVLPCVPRTAAVPGSSQSFFYLIKDRCHFSI